MKIPRVCNFFVDDTAELWHATTKIFPHWTPDLDKSQFILRFSRLRAEFYCQKHLILRLPGGGGADATLTGFSNFSLEWKELFFQTKFLAVGSFLGHLFMKKFSDQTYRVGSKIRQRDGAGWGRGGNYPH